MDHVQGRPPDRPSAHRSKGDVMHHPAKLAAIGAAGLLAALPATAGAAVPGHAASPSWSPVGALRAPPPAPATTFGGFTAQAGPVVVVLSRDGRKVTRTAAALQVT